MSSDKRRTCTLIPWVPDDEWEDEEQLECNYLLMPASGAPASVTGSYTAAVPQTTMERAGRMFHHRQLQKVGHKDYDDYAEDDEDEDEDDVEEQDGFDDILDDPAWDLNDVKVIGRLTTESDHYNLLALGGKRIEATPAEIKSKYRRMCMIFHPDKNASRADFANDMIQKVNQAYDVLSDPAKRRVFDSLEEFDDDHPDEEKTKKAIAKHGAKGFFKLWGPVFQRNKRWSETKLETLGTEETLIGFVDEMYQSWFDFKSWREFPQDDDEDVDKAESREEKRHMERQNKAAGDRAKKEEKKRINDMVDLAYRYDPRIVARREAEKQAKLDAKEAKRIARTTKHVILIQKIVRGWVKRSQYNRERNAKKKAAKDGAKKNQKANRKRVKKAAAAAGINAEYTEDLASKLDAENALELAEKMEACGKDATASWKHFNVMSAKVGLPAAPEPTPQ
jgi:DnaJ family protein C protein 2